MTGLGTSPERTPRAWRFCGLGSGPTQGGLEYTDAGAARRGRSGGGLHDYAKVHHRDPMTHVLHDTEVVGDEEIGISVAPLEVLYQVEDLGLDGHVQGGGGLVKDDEFRPRDRAPGRSRCAAAARH